MKSFFKILVAPLVWLLHSCSPIGDPVDKELSPNHYYNKSKTDVIFSSLGNWFELGKKKMNVDMETFKVLNPTFAKDKNHLYCFSFKIEHPQLDLASFYTKGETAVEKAQMSDVGFDKNHVYTTISVKNGDTYSTELKILDNADPTTFKRIDYDWAKDKKSYYFHDSPIFVDYKSFETLNEFYSRDKNHMYWHTYSNFVKTDADPDTFTLLDTHRYIAKDDKALYITYYDEEHTAPIKIPYSSEDQVKLYNEYYFTVNDIVYYLGKPIHDADRSTFEPIDDFYAKDENSVFYNGKIVQGADFKTFKHDTGGRYKDKNGTFMAGEAVK